MNHANDHKHDQELRYQVTIYTTDKVITYLDQFFKSNRKWKKGAFFLEAALEKIEREEEEEAQRRSHGNSK